MHVQTTPTPRILVVDLGGASVRPPTAQNFLNFMQFFAKFGKIICWRPPEGWRPLLWEILDPPLNTNVHPPSSRVLL